MTDRGTSDRAEGGGNQVDACPHCQHPLRGHSALPLASYDNIRVFVCVCGCRVDGTVAVVPT